MRKFVTKKRAIAAGIAVLVAGGSMAAYAYFTGGATSKTGQGQTGSTVTWTVSDLTFTGGPMYPGGFGTQTANYTITNGGTGNQALASVTASVNAGTGGAVTENGTAHAGCLAAWYSAGVTGPSPATSVTIAPGDAATGTVTVNLTESDSDQNACKGVTPDVTLNVA